MGKECRIGEGREYVCSMPVHACTSRRHDRRCWSVGGKGGEGTVLLIRG